MICAAERGEGGREREGGREGEREREGGREGGRERISKNNLHVQGLKITVISLCICKLYKISRT